MQKEPEQAIWNPAEDLISEERLAKGDLVVTYNGRGKIKSAVPGHRYIIDRLVWGELLDYHHAVYGVGFLELRTAFRAPWATRISAVLLEQFGKGVSLSRATEIYQNVCNGFRGRGQAVVEYALETEVDSSPDRYGVGLYQEHFQRLVELMDQERERIYREEQDKAEKMLGKK